MTTLLNLDPSQVPDDDDTLVYNAASKKWLPGRLGAVDVGAAPAPTGTPDGTKFYRDDGTWAAVPAGVETTGAVTHRTSGLRAVVLDYDPAPLIIPTYEGSGQSVHPSVIYVPEGLSGYRYWMGFTPYPGAGSATHENPSIAASHDGLTWEIPDGLTNPIQGKPTSHATDYNSDANLVYADGWLYCFYRSVETGLAPLSERIYYKRSRDGITWETRTLSVASDPAVRHVLSPSVIRDGDRWVMYGVDPTGTNRVVRRISTTTPDEGEWGEPEECAGIHPFASGFEPWHVHALRAGDEWQIVVYHSPNGSSTHGGLLVRATSPDGLNFTNDPGEIQRSVEGVAGNYMASVVPATIDGSPGYRMWWSGYSVAAGWRIRHSTVTLRDEESASDGIARAALALPPYIAGDTMNRPNASTVGTMSSGQAWTVDEGSPGISDRAIVDNTGAGFTVSVNHGLTDNYEAGVTVQRIPTAGRAWVRVGMGLPSGPSRQWFGFCTNLSAGYRVEYYVAGVLTYQVGITNRPPADGDRIAIRVRSGVATCYVNDMPIVSRDISPIAGTSVAALNSYTTMTRFRNFYVKSL